MILDVSENAIALIYAIPRSSAELYFWQIIKV